jgi:hypothetical protein
LVAAADVDRTDSAQQPALAAVTDLALVALFRGQHSIMARPWFSGLSC